MFLHRCHPERSEGPDILKLHFLLVHLPSPFDVSSGPSLRSG
jgi:hypothetical protein